MTGRSFPPRADLLSSRVPIVAPPPKQEAPCASSPGAAVAYADRDDRQSVRRALRCFKASDTDAVLRLRVGQENDGWLVRGIGLRSIVVEKGAESVELDLPRPNGAPAQ